MEPLYEKLLKFLTEHSEDRHLLSSELVSMVRSFRFSRESDGVKLSVDAIAFCMHQLRWSEVLEVAKSEHDTSFSKKRSSTLLPLISAFDDEWEEAEDYRLFREKSGRPGRSD